MWELLKKISPFEFNKCAKIVAEELERIKQEIHDIREENAKTFEAILEDYKAYAKAQEERAEFYSMSLEYIGDLLPDMIWMKWSDGKYAYANKAIKDGLLFDDTPLEKTDVEIGHNAQKFFGANRHNFGTYCAGSDTLTIELGHRKRFIEYGMSGGKPLVLEVYKNVVRNENGEIIATVGCGRDITDNIFTMLRLEEISLSNGKSHDIINSYLDKYLYENETIPETLRDFYKEHKGVYCE